MQKISCIICTLNEEKNIPDLFESVKEVDEIIVVDHGSTDKTVELAKSLGAKVIKKEVEVNIPTQEDVNEFTHRLGYRPDFKANDKLPNWEKEFNICNRYAKYDWILWMSGDERIKWDKSKVAPLMDNYDAIFCLYRFSPEINYGTSKLFNRNKTFWVDMLHTIIDGYNIKVIDTKDMEIVQYQDEREYRKKYMAGLEYNFLQRNDIRSAYNLGKEYHNHLEHEKAIKMFDIYLTKCSFKPEYYQSYVFMSANYWDSGNREKAVYYAMEALKIDPTKPHPYYLMAQFDGADPAKYDKWMKIYESMKGHDIIN